jgi:hypothetical protein
MQYAWYFIVFVVILAGFLVLVLRGKKHKVPQDPKEQVRELVQAGIMYEEQFVEMYFKVIRDEGFMQNFGLHQDEAKQLLTTMIEESKGHKQLLDNVLANLK